MNQNIVQNPIPDPQAYNTNKGAYGVDENINFMNQNYNLADKNQFDAYKTKVDNTPNQPAPKVTQPKSVDQQELDSATSKYNQVSNDYDHAFQTFQSAAQAYQNGATPLSAGQTAQIQGLQQEFQQLINNQKLVNKGAEGTANIRGYQKGSAEYDPTFQTKVIGNIFSAGQAKVADLQTKMASAVAELTSAFQKENYSGVKDAWDEYEQYADKQKEEFKTNMEKAQTAISVAQEQQRQQERDNNVASLINQGYTKPAELLEFFKSNGLSYSAKEIGDTVANLIKKDAYPGGIIGEYQFYADQEKDNGRIPLSFSDYQTLDANRKVSIAKAGVAGTGLNDKDRSVFNQIVTAYNASPAIKALDRASQLREITANIRNNPEDPAQQLNLIYAYVKGLDTDSAVREGEIDLVKGIQSYMTKYQTEFDRITQGKTVSKDTAINMANGADSLITSIERTAKRKKAVFDAQAVQNGTAVTESWKDFSKSIEEANQDINKELEDGQDPKQTVDTYIANNPDDADEIMALYDVEGIDEKDVVEYLKLHNLIP